MSIAPSLKGVSSRPHAHSHPHATHQTLRSHTDEIVEYLDYEYSSKGGLLGILPPKEDKEDRQKSRRNTFRSIYSLHSMFSRNTALS